MIGLLRRAAAAPKPAPPDLHQADLRDRLRAAQMAAEAAGQAVQRAAQVAERGRAAVASAQGALGAFAALDGRVAGYRADQLRAGNGGPALLPADLVAARAEQDAARRELIDAEAAAALLDEDAREAKEAADQAAAVLAAAIEAIGLVEHARVLERMRAHEREASRLRWLAAAFLDGRTLSDPTLNWEHREFVEARHHGILLDVLPPENRPGPQPWNAFRKALAADADAEAPK